MDMELTDITNPYKVLKMDSGEDVICKVTTEYKDAFVVERPMSITETPQFHEELGEMVNQTGLAKWMNFTNDVSFIIPKSKIQSLANLAPEVTYFYRNICAKMAKAEEHLPKTLDEVQERILYMKNLADTISNATEDSDSNVVQFPPDKTKLH